MTGPMVTLAAYFLGSIPFGYLIVRWRRGIDVRTTGSGNIGATNVMRNLGVGGFLITLLLDAGKGTLAVEVAARTTGNHPAWVAAAALATIFGHCFPVWLRFRGGKGVATGVGVYVALAPASAAVCIAIFTVVVALGRYVSLGSIVATAAFPALLHFVSHSPRPIVFGALAGACIVIGRHHANIRRLASGTENRLGQKKAGVGTP